MERLLFVFTALLVACSDTDRTLPENFRERTVVLKDIYEDTAFGEVKLFVPKEMDTLLTWVDASDCPCCDVKKYRFTSSRGCLIQESGFFKIEFCRDSFKRFTIEHQCFERKGYPYEDLPIDDSLAKLLIDKINASADVRPHTPVEWRRKEITSIDNRPFILLHWQGPTWEVTNPVEYIMALTKSNSMLLVFKYECYNQDCADFSTEAFKSIYSIIL